MVFISLCRQLDLGIDEDTQGGGLEVKFRTSQIFFFSDKATSVFIEVSHLYHLFVI